MKQRDLFKSRVKRLLKEQKDMGQVSDAAVLVCSSVLQAFVKDMATNMQKQAVKGAGLTPIELKKSVLASSELRFLHEKVAAIDENDAKYHKPAHRGKKRRLNTAAKKSSTKKAQTLKTRKVVTTATASATSKRTKQAPGNGSVPIDDATEYSSKARMQTLDVEEDDNYDESESDA